MFQCKFCLLLSAWPAQHFVSSSATMWSHNAISLIVNVFVTSSGWLQSPLQGREAIGACLVLTVVVDNFPMFGNIHFSRPCTCLYKPGLEYLRVDSFVENNSNNNYIVKENLLTLYNSNHNYLVKENLLTISTFPTWHPSNLKQPWLAIW